jgi:hypothetical protein
MITATTTWRLKTSSKTATHDNSNNNMEAQNLQQNSNT